MRAARNKARKLELKNENLKKKSGTYTPENCNQRGAYALLLPRSDAEGRNAGDPAKNPAKV